MSEEHIDQILNVNLNGNKNYTVVISFWVSNLYVPSEGLKIQYFLIINFIISFKTKYNKMNLNSITHLVLHVIYEVRLQNVFILRLSNKLSRPCIVYYYYAPASFVLVLYRAG